MRNIEIQEVDTNARADEPMRAAWRGRRHSRVAPQMFGEQAEGNLVVRDVQTW